MEQSKGSPEAAERPASPCWKKKQPEGSFLDNAKDHLGQFVSTSMDQHRICLKKTIRGMGDYVKLKKQGKPSSPPSPKSVDESSSGAKGAEVDAR